MKKYIPIIGTISAGKTSFLRAFLGTDVLQVGSVTTTKFVCLIKNSLETSFYHVLPKKEKTIYFEKEGEETKGEKDIKKRIEEVNTILKEKKGTINDIFYMLEIPIKNIENIPLLENCYFMDIPGLNENATNYINDIFSFISIEHILFEIVVFDSTSIGSDNILNIFTSLEEKKCLCKSNNIFILNKIDQCTGGSGENIIEGFKKYFYETFEDEKKKDRLVNLNIYDNYFVPMNSILYRAETRLTDDFTSLLVFELFSYLENDSEKNSFSFFEYIEKRINVIISREKLDIDKDVKNINENEFKITLEESVNNLKNVLKNIKDSTQVQLGLNLKKKSVEKVMKKLYIIQKLQKYIAYHSEFYVTLQEIIKNISINKEDLSSPPILKNKKEKEIENEEKKQDIKVDNGINIIDELDTFLNETFKEIDPNDELKEFKISLQTLRENILGRKIRISFIGNISVGKSSVLNCIIGHDILPTKDSECTYRGVILRHRNDKNYKLYRTKLITRGDGLDEYYYFIDESKWHCNGIPAIKDYLNNKNNDKNIADEDAYIVITGRLKIFDYITLDEEIIKKIEFIDLPGPDRKNNTFNDKKYYQKILKFSNCCIYINEPKTIHDKNSVRRMIDQYSSDKSKVFATLRNNFIKTCLFLVNKADTLEDEDVKKEIIHSLVKIIREEEKNLKEDEMNVSFFSGKYFMYYLNIYNQYITQIDENPVKLLNQIYKEWGDKLTLSSFKSYTIKKIETIQEKFNFDSEEEIESTEEFHSRLSSAMDKLFEGKFRGTTEDEEDEIIEKLYCFYHQLKSANFENTNYSHSFFDELKKVILFSDKFQNDNMKCSILEFFMYTDQLFDKEITKENESEKKMMAEKYNFFKNEIIPRIKKLFERKKKAILEIYELGLYRCQGFIDEEIKNVDNVLKSANNDIESAAKNFEMKIDNMIKELNDKKTNEINNLHNEIEKELNEAVAVFYSKNQIDTTKIDINKGITMKMFFSVIGSAISGIAVRSGLVMVGQSLIAGTAAVASSTLLTSTSVGTALLGPTGVAIGFGVGIVISVGTLLHHYLSKSKRYVTGLEQTKIDINLKFDEIKNMFLNDFSSFETSLFKKLNLNIEIMKKDIECVDVEKWKMIKEKYQAQKKNIQNKINYFK